MYANKFYLRGLESCLKKFDEDGHFSSCGRWSIARSGYDLYFILYYDNLPIVECVCNELKVLKDNYFTNTNEVIKTIKSIYKNLNK